MTQPSAYNAVRNFSSHLRMTVKTLHANDVNPIEIVRECKRLYPDLRKFTTSHVRLICLPTQEKRPMSVRPISLGGPQWSLPTGTVHWKSQLDVAQSG